MVKNRERLFELLTLVFSVIPIFGSFLYYLGRRYTESYFEVLGVPPDALTFSFADYLYIAIKHWLFLIAVVLTSLVFVLWYVIKQQRIAGIVVPHSLPRKEPKWKVLAERIKGLFRMVLKTFSYKKGDP